MQANMFVHPHIHAFFLEFLTPSLDRNGRSRKTDEEKNIAEVTPLAFFALRYGNYNFKSFQLVFTYFILARRGSSLNHFFHHLVSYTSFGYQT